MSKSLALLALIFPAALARTALQATTPEPADLADLVDLVDLDDGAATDRLLFSVRNPVALPGPTPPTTFVVFNYGPGAKDEELTVFCTLSNAGCEADPLSNVVTFSTSAGQTGTVGAVLSTPGFDVPLDCFVVVTTDKVELCVPVEARTGAVDPDEVSMVGSSSGNAHHKSVISSEDPSLWSPIIASDAVWTSLTSSRMTISTSTGGLYYVNNVSEWLDQQPSQTFPDGWTVSAYTGDSMLPGPFDTDGDALIAWSAIPGGGPLKATHNFTQSDAVWDLEIFDAAAIAAAIDMNRIVYASVLPSGGDIEIRLISDVWGPGSGAGARSIGGEREIVASTLCTVPIIPPDAPPGTTQTIKSVSLSGQFLVFTTEDSNAKREIYQIDLIKVDIVLPSPIPYPFTDNPAIALGVRGPVAVAVTSEDGTCDLLAWTELGRGHVEDQIFSNDRDSWYPVLDDAGPVCSEPMDGVALDQISVSSRALTTAGVEAFAQRLVTWLEEESNDLSWLPGANTPTGDQSASFAPQSPQQVIEQILWRMRSDGLAGATSYDVPRVEQDIELPTPNLVRPTSWIIGF